MRLASQPGGSVASFCTCECIYGSFCVCSSYRHLSIKSRFEGIATSTRQPWFTCIVTCLHTLEKSSMHFLRAPSPGDAIPMHFYVPTKTWVAAFMHSFAWRRRGFFKLFHIRGSVPAVGLSRLSDLKSQAKKRNESDAQAKWKLHQIKSKPSANLQQSPIKAQTHLQQS